MLVQAGTSSVPTISQNFVLGMFFSLLSIFSCTHGYTVMEPCFSWLL